MPFRRRLRQHLTTDLFPKPASVMTYLTSSYSHRPYPALTLLLPVLLRISYSPTEAALKRRISGTVAVVRALSCGPTLLHSNGKLTRTIKRQTCSIFLSQS